MLRQRRGRVGKAQVCELTGLEALGSRPQLNSLSPQNRAATPAVHPFEVGKWVLRRNLEDTRP